MYVLWHLIVYLKHPLLQIQMRSMYDVSDFSNFQICFFLVRLYVHHRVIQRHIDPINKHFHYMAMYHTQEWVYICKFFQKYFFLKIFKNSLICKAALHDGRVAPWLADNSTIFITNTSITSFTFFSTLRNGIVSGRSIGFPYLVYQFASNRINGFNKKNIYI